MIAEALHRAWLWVSGIISSSSSGLKRGRLENHQQPLRPISPRRKRARVGRTDAGDTSTCGTIGYSGSITKPANRRSHYLSETTRRYPFSIESLSNFSTQKLRRHLTAKQNPSDVRRAKPEVTREYLALYGGLYDEVQGRSEEKEDKTRNQPSDIISSQQPSRNRLEHCLLET